MGQLNDWRSLPRVAKGKKKSASIGVRCTEAQAAAIREAAAAVGLTVSEWIITKVKRSLPKVVR